MEYGVVEFVAIKVALIASQAEAQLISHGAYTTFDQPQTKRARRSYYFYFLLFTYNGDIRQYESRNVPRPISPISW